MRRRQPRRSSCRPVREIFLGPQLPTRRHTGWAQQPGDSMADIVNTPRHSKVSTVLRVTSGNFMEMFDFFLFGFYATYISRTFFPSGDEFASLMLTFMTFGAGFLMRPLGAIFLGSYVDRVGRRRGLIVTLALMAMGTVLIAFVPAYATIGFAA